MHILIDLCRLGIYSQVSSICGMWLGVESKSQTGRNARPRCQLHPRVKYTKIVFKKAVYKSSPRHIDKFPLLMMIIT